MDVIAIKAFRLLGLAPYDPIETPLKTGRPKTGRV
jgi:hypothetical protein